jgi:hypothetical protein
MTDPNVTTPSAPAPADDSEALVTQLVKSLARHGATAGGGFLLANGLIARSQKVEFEDIAVSIALGLLALGWSFLQKWMAKS